MTSGGPGILTASTQAITSPELARRAWPQWLALGIAMIAVAVTAVVWTDSGARVLLGALGLFLAVRGGLLVRGGRSGGMDAGMAGRARSTRRHGHSGGAPSSEEQRPDSTRKPRR